ncbi:hypothetical protein GGS23DRAFT_537627 [Durotheca rogersii]|uniref:uncharacterized protein n=1 Tax=Durotheca rogersii TaxID=419775 RepID=UPI00222068E0|nr:uncharacterized protein GGS23DRAFT_537627 [Durotheca rogersii]KAI5863512.1 hypothetical protein GGS23DRAFT_537627 [Durotheca rogersii]
MTIPAEDISPAPDPVPRGPVTATLNFASRPAPGVKVVNHVDGGPRNLGVDARAVLIADIRGREAAFTLDRDGFELVSGLAPSLEDSAPGSGFADDASVRRLYYPEVARLLLRRVPGSTRVLIFDHTVRRADAAAPRRPVFEVHVDQTAAGAARRARFHLSSPPSAASFSFPPGAPDPDLRRCRYRIVNVWRPLTRGPVAERPLAFASGASVDDARDLIPVEHRYPLAATAAAAAPIATPPGYVGETAAVAYHPTQRWYYASGVRPDERLLLECFDSAALAPDAAVPSRGRTPHTAFEDPRTPPDAEPRESIEVRALVFGP